MWLIPLKLFAGNALKGVLSFLASLNIWQILCLVLAGFALFQTVRVHSEQRHSAKLESQIVKLNDQLQRITTAKNEQVQTTVRTIEQSRVIAKDADGRAKKVENAPLPGQCKTPSAVMSADL